MSSINRELMKIRPLSAFVEPLAPIAWVGIADAAASDRVRAHLCAIGWRVVSARERSGAPAMLISDSLDAGADAGYAARVKLADGDDGGYDAALALPFDLFALTCIADYWDPRATIAGARRLAALFGEAPIAAALIALRVQLADILGTVDIQRAHRIAGVAGTLGFPAASAAWLAVSEGKPNALPTAHREARRVILAVDAAVARSG